MNLELLANETILELFEYLSIDDLFHGFYNLNSRFNNLLTRQFKKFRLDLQLLSKTKCTDICENIVPLVIDQIISLRLSNDDNTPGEMKLFLSQSYQLRQFTHLQSIALKNILSVDELNQLMIECTYLPHLTYLSIYIDSMLLSVRDADHLYSQIWNLKSLTHCFIDIETRYEIYLPKLIFISTSLKNLTDHWKARSLSTLNYLFENTPNLEYLSIKFDGRSDQLGTITPMLSLTRAKIFFRYGSIDILEHFLQYMPNLSHLILDLYEFYVDGHEWEEIIHKYLLKLKVFQFTASFTFYDGEKHTMTEDEIIDTYRTKFWIEERQWFVQCDFNNSNEFQIACFDLFTLPYNFNRYFYRHYHHSSASTNPYNDDYLVFDRVKYLIYEYKFPPCNIHFPNIRWLSLSIPFNDKFFTVISKFDRLNSLYININYTLFDDSVAPQLQLIVNQAPHLRLLGLRLWEQLNDRTLLKEITSNSIRQLILQTYGRAGSYNDEECTDLIHTPLGRQCETLSIKTKNRKNILDLINMMPNLQALNVECDDDTLSRRYMGDETLQDNKNDELIEWLQNQLPSTFIIRRYTFYDYTIRIWIR
ncbi:unnamed protein product [Rotaria magnacalcarata]|uniref:F-box domain-containing protein n=3 Tax=Rotaria magnacalcarata TaxID=392030 RepID=A0A816BSX7_9BILA|nr:unnamed protein product [Rotaria magnacalcarata]